jgi:hypothetical protein
VEAEILESELIPEIVANERWLDRMVDGEVNYMLEQLWSEDETEELEIEEAEHAGVVDRALGVWGERVRKGVEVEGLSFVEEEGKEIVMDVDGGGEDV